MGDPGGELPGAEADVPVPASLDRMPGKCCSRATDGDGNQASFHRLRRPPSVAFSRQPAKTTAARWLPRYCLDQGDDLRLRESLPFTILGVPRLHET